MRWKEYEEVGRGMAVKIMLMEETRYLVIHGQPERLSTDIVLWLSEVAAVARVSGRHALGKELMSNWESCYAREA